MLSAQCVFGQADVIPQRVVQFPDGHIPSQDLAQDRLQQLRFGNQLQLQCVLATEVVAVVGQAAETNS